MSRTYRRRKDTWDLNAYEYVWVDNSYLVKKYLDKKSPEYKIKKAKFHQDTRRYGSGVPSWFVNLFCERKMRQKTKKEIHKWMKNPENVECMPPQFIRDARWLYW